MGSRAKAASWNSGVQYSPSNRPLWVARAKTGCSVPLFFQVVIDKVLVHHSMSTLDVLVIGLVTISVFEAILGILRTYLFSHTTNRIDVELGARLFRHLMALPIAYFQVRWVGDSVARVRELENIRNFLTSSAADAAVVDSLKALDPNRPIREADIIPTRDLFNLITNPTPPDDVGPSPNTSSVRRCLLLTQSGNTGSGGSASAGATQAPIRFSRCVTCALQPSRR
jgi:ABC-type multidrug transport system fused ATPase/permease subunit